MNIYNVPKIIICKRILTNQFSKKNIHKVSKEAILSPHVYKPVGPYSQAILADKTLYVSGVLGMDVKGQFVPGGVKAQTRQALDNMKHILTAGGASLDSVIKTTIFLANMEDFQLVNDIYAKYFKTCPPARATFQVAVLPKKAEVEIDAIALSGDLVIVGSKPCTCT